MGVRLVNGGIVLVDIVFVFIGVFLEIVLVEVVGLFCDDGIVVDEFICIVDFVVLVIGDCICYWNLLFEKM